MGAGKSDLQRENVASLVMQCGCEVKTPLLARSEAGTFRPKELEVSDPEHHLDFTQNKQFGLNILKYLVFIDILRLRDTWVKASSARHAAACCLARSHPSLSTEEAGST